MNIGFFASFNETAGGVFQYAVSMFHALRQRTGDTFTAFLMPGSPLRAYIPTVGGIVEVPPQIFTTNADRAGIMGDDGLDLLEKGSNRRAAAFFR